MSSFEDAYESTNKEEQRTANHNQSQIKRKLLIWMVGLNGWPECMHVPLKRDAISDNETHGLTPTDTEQPFTPHNPQIAFRSSYQGQNQHGQCFTTMATRL